MAVVSYRAILDGAEPRRIPVGTATLWHVPAADIAGPAPALVWIHGGAWRGGDANVFWPHARYFASRGLASFSIGYRRVAVGGPTVDAALEDTRAALGHVLDHAAALGVDPTRVAVAGDSAGGHLAACLAALPAATRHPAALVLCNPITDATEDPWPATALGVAIPEGQPAPAATPDQRRQAEDFSPIHRVRAPHPPTLLLHGDVDAIVPCAQSLRYAERLRALGTEVDLDILPGARHAFVVPRWKTPEEQVVDHWRRIDAWLARRGWLTGAPTLGL
jgi:acetyl esterase/lipase